MHGKTLRLRPALALAGAALTLSLLPAAATGKPTIASLRVEAGGQALSPGVSYVNDTARVHTNRNQCNGSGRSYTASGPTAMGIVAWARQTNGSLRPLWASDKFDFGLIICRIGSFGAFGTDQAWLYRVNHAVAEVAGDQFTLERGDQVLWYFANFTTGANTGNELALSTPARVRPGQQFTVTAFAYDFAGKRSPAAGVRIGGDATAITGPDGTARLVANGNGSFDLRGTRGNDVSTPPVAVCVNDQLSKCPAIRGQLIVGTSGPDGIAGTRGADLVTARGGNDTIDVRGWERDRVRCGRGHDLLRATHNDVAAGDCERVIRSGPR